MVISIYGGSGSGKTTLAEKGYATYDFFLPGLVIDEIENRRGT